MFLAYLLVLSDSDPKEQMNCKALKQSYSKGIDRVLLWTAVPDGGPASLFCWFALFQLYHLGVTVGAPLTAHLQTTVEAG